MCRAQKEITGRWPIEKTIQWVRFDALVSSDRQYAVEVGPASEESAPPLRLTLTESNGKLTVDTGTATYVLGRGISPIEEIRSREKRLATSSGARGLYLIDQNGRVASAAATGETVVHRGLGAYRLVCPYD